MHMQKALVFVKINENFMQLVFYSKFMIAKCLSVKMLTLQCIGCVSIHYVHNLPLCVGLE